MKDMKYSVIACTIALSLGLGLGSVYAGTPFGLKSNGNLNFNNGIAIYSEDLSNVAYNASKQKAAVESKINVYANGTGKSTLVNKSGSYATWDELADGVANLGTATAGTKPSQILYGYSALVGHDIVKGSFNPKTIIDAINTKGYSLSASASDTDIASFILNNWRKETKYDITYTYHYHVVDSSQSATTTVKQNNLWYGDEDGQSKSGGCYTKLVNTYHRHDITSTTGTANAPSSGMLGNNLSPVQGGCFMREVRHRHSGNTVSGGTCYNQYVQGHKHDDSCLHKHKQSCYDYHKHSESCTHKCSGSPSKYGGCYTILVSETKTTCGGTVSRVVKDHHDDGTGNCSSGVCQTFIYCSVCGHMTTQPGCGYEDWIGNKHNNEIVSRVYKKSCNGPKTCDIPSKALACGNPQLDCKAQEGYTGYILTCLYDNNELLGYELSCGKSDTSVISTKYYKSCGKVSGQILAADLIVR